MSKSTDIEIKELIGAVNSKLDLLTQDVAVAKSKLDLLAQDVAIVKSTLDKMDSKLWAFGGLILAACLTALLKTISI
jgi:hypothetical protein